MNLEKALPSDIDPVLNLIVELSAWLRSRGIHQWSGFPRAQLELEVRREELFVWKDHPALVGSVALTSERTKLWEDLPGSALYLEHLVIDRRYAGQGQGEKLTDWCFEQARARQIPALRLVTDAKNLFLPAYYSRLGFQAHGVVRHAGYQMDFIRFEKRTGVDEESR